MSVDITITGDFCPINRIEPLLLDKGHFETVLSDITNLFAKSDLNITNLECPMVNEVSPASKYGPHLHTNGNAVELLKFLNIGLVTLANNHIMDHGVAGLEATLAHLAHGNIAYVGAGLNEDDMVAPFIFEEKGVAIAIINVAENEFIAIKEETRIAGANAFVFTTLLNQIRSAKNKADFVLVIVHGGNENFWLPSPRFRDALRFCVEVGTDAVVAHHTHCFNGYEVYREKPIFYGIGNFIFDGGPTAPKGWNLGLAVTLTFDKEEGVNFKVTPFQQNLAEKLGISLLNERERVQFDEDCRQMEKIINNTADLRKEFHRFIEKVEKQYAHYLQPYTNKYFHKLFSLGIIPSVFENRRKRLLYQNLIRCESHRDIVLRLLENENRYS